ncbi:VanZ family protein [Micromonospora sp. DR5-3]|nr:MULTISPECIES: VanZ family protein [unclassified Micromonospora]MCW3820281.1 VanZ family protein [Micromonospora sp. DR5-3]
MAQLTVTVQVVGNLLVFAALGFFAPLRFAAFASVPRILALAAGCSVLVEAAQYVLRLDRTSSVDDSLLNGEEVLAADHEAPEHVFENSSLVFRQRIYEDRNPDLRDPARLRDFACFAGADQRTPRERLGHPGRAAV